MKTTNNKPFPLLAGILFSLFLFLGGCTKLDLSHCPDQVNVSVVAVGEDGEEITDPDVVRDLSLYVFDKDKRFLEQLRTYIGEPLQIYYPDQDELYVVSWGNLDGGTVELPPLTRGTPMHEAYIRLLDAPQEQRSKAPATRSIAMSPSDLFYSCDEIYLKTGTTTTYKLVMNRKVSAMAVTIRNLQSYANRYDDDYSLVVRDTYNTLDFYAQLRGDKVGYAPAAAFNQKKELIAPLFNLLPSHAEGVVEIDVYHGDELITTVKNDSQGQPFKAEAGKVLNVLVDFRLNVTVEVSTTPWGTTHIWKDF